MSTAADAPQTTQLDANYRAARIRLQALVALAVQRIWQQAADRQQLVQQTVAVVEQGQAQMVRLVDAYMAAKTLLATGEGTVKGLDPGRYTISVLRGVAAATVYSRPFGAYGAFLNEGADKARAAEAARASVAKLAATDVQLAQAHAARDWMRDDARIVGWRRVLNPPSCELCTLASTRTYRKADLLPIHEHCDCGVEPLYGHEPVASVGTTVRVEEDPELGPRLMADNWSPVGPRLI